MPLLTAAVLAATCWLPPVDAPVVDPFRPPPCAWCPGNRGLEYGLARPTTVRAVATGTVTFSGVVAGTRYVVVRHGDGLRVTYGRLLTTRLAEGDVVAARSVIGTADRSLFFGVRDGERYVDPAPFLGRLVGRVRLIPTDGRPARRPPPPRLDCRAPTRFGVEWHTTDHSAPKLMARSASDG